MRILALVALLLAPLVAVAQPQIERVEPAFWWTGMHHPELQILVHGNGVGLSHVELAKYEGVTLDRVTAVANPNYLFLTLTIGTDAAPGPLSFQFTSSTGTTTHPYELKARTREPGTYAQGFASDDVIYLMMPDRFANGDPTNDSIDGMLESADRSNPNGRHGGDLAGIRDRLGYIDDLGMTAIWLTPVFENDMTPEYGAYHGYAATDMYRIDPRFGTNAEFLALVEDSHQRGIKVIMDMIHNHVGDQHWWMDDLPTPDWVHDWEEVGQTNFTWPAAADPYASEADRYGLVNGWFVREMPDLNQTNPLVAQYLIQNTLWWIEYAGIDGIRMDTHIYADKDYMARWVRSVLDAYPTFNIVGEAWAENIPNEAYWQRGFQAHPEAYDSYLPSVTDFPLSFTMHHAFGDGTLRDLYEGLAQDHVYPEPNRLVTFLDNHDIPRFFSLIDEDLGAFRLAYAFLMTTRGIPQVYYGTELATPNGTDRQRGDGYKRTDMPGGWPDDPRSAFTAEGRTASEAAAFDFVQPLTRWRQTANAIHHGRLTHFSPREDVYVYFRWTDEATVMVILNDAPEARQLELSRFQERLLDFTSGRDVVTGRTYDLTTDALLVPAKTPLVLDLAR